MLFVHRRILASLRIVTRFNDQLIGDVISYDETAGEIHYYERHWSSQELIPDADDPTGYRTARSKGQVKCMKKYEEPKSDAITGSSSEPGYNPWYPHGYPDGLSCLGG